MTIIVTAAGHIAADHRDAALAAMIEVQAQTAAESGCIEYRFWTAVDDPNAILLYERWEDQSSLNRHLDTPHVARFNEVIASAADAPIVLARHEVAASGPAVRV